LSGALPKFLPKQTRNSDRLERRARRTIRAMSAQCATELRTLSMPQQDAGLASETSAIRPTRAAVSAHQGLKNAKTPR
jgi:hypothetical protein